MNAGQMPPEHGAEGHDLEGVARILDHLSDEIREAAHALRASDHPPDPAGSPGRASCDPWSIVDLVTHDLSRRGIKSQFGSEADLSIAAQSAARLLEALGLCPVASLAER